MGGWVAGWLSEWRTGPNKNKANIRPAKVGTELSLAKLTMSYLGFPNLLSRGLVFLKANIFKPKNYINYKTGIFNISSQYSSIFIFSQPPCVFLHRQLIS